MAELKRPLGHGARHRHDVHFLEGKGADGCGGDLAGQGEHRDAIHPRRCQPGHEVGGPGAAGGQANSDPSGSSGVAVGRVGGVLLVAHQHVPEAPLPVGQLPVKRQGGAAGIAEDDVDAVRLQRGAQQVRARYFRCNGWH